MRNTITGIITTIMIGLIAIIYSDLKADLGAIMEIQQDAIKAQYQLGLEVERLKVQIEMLQKGKRA